MDRLLALTADAESRHFWFRGFRGFVTPFIARAARGRRTLRLLDCGCGTGANLSLLAPYGSAVGFDLTLSGLVHGRREGRSRLVQASIDAMPIPDASIDVVTSFDVLYSLPDQVEAGAIREMYRVLRPGGAAVITSAALDILTGGHSTLSAEVRRYTRHSLRTRLEAAGFVVERITYTHAAVFPITLAVRLLQRLRYGNAPPPTELEITVPPAPLNAALSALLMLEATALRVLNMPAGSSVLCLARRPA